jgi:hypothetical protein
MAEDRASIWLLPIWLLMDVTEILSFWRECKAAQVASGEDVGQSSSAFNFEELERTRAFSAFFDLEEQEAPVRGNA